MRYLKQVASLFLMAISSLFSTHSMAHGLEPIFISVITMENNQYRVELRLPDEFKEENSPYFIFPGDCSTTQFNSLISTINCQEPLVGKKLDIRFDYYVPQISTLVNYYDLDGKNELVEITDQQSWTMPGEISASSKNLRYLSVGFEHILGGFDHVLFIICLLMIIKSRRKLIQAITGFTIAHSITLFIVSIGLIKPAIEPIEIIIAMSVLLLAYEVLSNKQSFTSQYPVIVSFFCGLLHGVGFSSVLSEINTANIIELSSILFFNIGVEIGQLLIVFTWLLISTITHKFNFDQKELYKARVLSIYLTGGLAMYWVLDRFILWFEARSIHLFV
ncbi:HupE/UreJ family protein [Vibrio ishigakensis]|uniref:HupE/UreJ family protein n=1 Tax=Vibrio ishigakensis TaxID=1481914 RepID=UPI0021C2E709|nr:HupE/UreJ family protein [Vibrio ishigakensis]